MLTDTFNTLWAPLRLERSKPAPACKRPAPVFIGDAVQPFAGETLLLKMLRAEVERATNEPP